MKKTKTKVVEKISKCLWWRKVFYKAVICVAGWVYAHFCFACRNVHWNSQTRVRFCLQKKTVNLEFCDRVWRVLFRMIFILSLRKLSAHIYAAKKVNKYKMRMVIPEPKFIYLSITIKHQQYMCGNHTENVTKSNRKQQKDAKEVCGVWTDIVWQTIVL